MQVHPGTYMSDYFVIKFAAAVINTGARLARADNRANKGHVSNIGQVPQRGSLGSAVKSPMRDRLRSTPPRM